MKKNFYLKHEQKLLSYNFRITWVFVLVFFGLLAQNVVNAQTTPSISAKQAHQASQTTNFTTNEDVKAFMAEERIKPLSADYQVPGYITSGQKVEDVFKELKQRYPEFYDCNDAQLLDAVKNAPVRYAKMLDENKAIRRYYDPNSKY